MKKFLYFTLAALYLGQIYASLANYWWGFELFTHYSLHFFWASTILGLLLLRRRMWKTLLLTTVIISIHLAQILPYYQAPSPTNAKGPEIKVFSSNFLVTNDDFETIKTVIAKEKPDTIVILEADYGWREQKSMFEAEYPYITISEKNGSFGIVMASKYPVEYKHFTLAGYEALEADLTVNGSPFRIIGVHPFPPSRSDLAELRNQQFEELIAKINSDKIPTAVMGDFNSSPWSPHFKELMAETGLKDAALGFGIINTWNVNIPLLKIPIDHVLTSPEIETLDFHRAVDVGSDHYPIVASLRLP